MTLFNVAIYINHKFINVYSWGNVPRIDECIELPDHAWNPDNSSSPALIDYTVRKVTYVPDITYTGNFYAKVYVS